MTLVRLYGKAGCHLCDDARAALAALARELGFEVEEIDITLDPVLFARYGERIPVAVLGGEELFEYHADAAAVRSALGRVSGP